MHISTARASFSTTAVTSDPDGGDGGGGGGGGGGVVDIKINHIESADEIASRIEQAERLLGEGRVRWVHPDCGFWMLKRSIADRKIAALALGRDKYLGIV